MWSRNEWAGQGGGCGECVRVYRYTMSKHAREERADPTSRLMWSTLPRSAFSFHSSSTFLASTAGSSRYRSPSHRLPMYSINKASRCS